MILSIIILCCDKDYQMVSSLLNNIYNVWQEQHDSFLNYQIIIVDNRENEADKDVDWYAYKGNIAIYKSGGNIRQFASRAVGTQFTKGDYIWFVDADDHILEIPRIPESDPEDPTSIGPDMLFFSTTANSTSLMLYEDLPEGYYEADKVYEKFFGMSIAPWNKIISRGLLMDIYKNIDRVHVWHGLKERFSVSEDLILNLFLFTYAHTIYISKQKCYDYNMQTHAYVLKDMYKKADIDRLTFRVYDSMWFIYEHIRLGALSAKFNKILQKNITNTLLCVVSRLPWCENKQEVIDWLICGWSKYAIADMLGDIYRNIKLEKRYDVINCIAMILNTDDNKTHTMEDLYEALNTNDVL